MAVNPLAEDTVDLRVYLRFITGNAWLFVLFALLTPLMSRQLFLKAPALETPQERFKRLVLAFGLTIREEEVVECLLRGMTYKQCAVELHISQNTVKFHALNAYRKAGVASRGELMTLFLESRAQPE